MKSTEMNSVRMEKAAASKTVLGRRSVLKFAAALGVAASSPAVLAACSDGANSTAGGEPATITLAFNRLLETLDNKLNQYDAQVTVHRAVREALVRVVGDDLQLEPALAESFEQTSPTEWTVTLREGLVYSDGTPVTPDDVAAALPAYEDVTRREGGFVGTFFPEWPTVKAVDERTFKLVTNEPIYTLDRLMSNIMLIPAGKQANEDVNDAPGTGPFLVTSADSGAGNYTLEPNPKYRGDAPGLQKVSLRFISQDSVRVAALQTGEVDVIDSVPPDAAAQLEGAEGITLIRSLGTRLVQFFYNFRNPTTPLLHDVKVREALSYAIDGEALVNDVLLRSVEPVNGVVPRNLVGAAEVGEYAYDPDRARSMLAAAGAQDLNLLMIWESGEFFSDAQVMEAVSAMLAEVGVTVTLKQFEPGGDLNEWRRGERDAWDLLGNGFGNQTGLALTNLHGQFSGTQENEADAFLGFIVPEVAEAIAAASDEPDEGARNELLKVAQEQIWDEWPCMWGFVQNNALAHRSRVKGIELLPGNYYDLSRVTVD